MVINITSNNIPKIVSQFTTFLNSKGLDLEKESYGKYCITKKSKSLLKSFFEEEIIDSVSFFNSSIHICCSSLQYEFIRNILEEFNIQYPELDIEVELDGETPSYY